MLKVIATIICLIPFFLGFLAIFGLYISYFSNKKSETVIEIRIEDEKEGA